MEQLSSSKEVSISQNSAYKLQRIRPGFCHAVRQSCSRYGISSIILGERNTQFSRVIYKINPLFKKIRGHVLMLDLDSK